MDKLQDKLQNNRISYKITVKFTFYKTSSWYILDRLQLQHILIWSRKCFIG